MRLIIRRESEGIHRTYIVPAQLIYSCIDVVLRSGIELGIESCNGDADVGVSIWREGS